MRKMNGKRFILGLMALMMCLTMCAPAFASTGDRVLFYSSEQNGNDDEKILNLFPYGDGFIIVMQKGKGQDDAVVLRTLYYVPDIVRYAPDLAFIIECFCHYGLLFVRSFFSFVYSIPQDHATGIFPIAFLGRLSTTYCTKLPTYIITCKRGVSTTHCTKSILLKASVQPQLACGVLLQNLISVFFNHRLRIPEIISGCWPFWPFCLMNCRFFSIFAVAKEPG